MKTRIAAGFATLAVAGALISVSPATADAAPVIGTACSNKQANDLRYTARHQPTVCAWMGAHGGHKWVRTARVDPKVRKLGSPCNNKYPVAKTPRGKAVVCSGGRWVYGP
ncbi:hypothetical protein AAFP35_10035 [Gordonia sp. CPCC 206044]|uniref:hypothetical protein n=1 Tax=Gordonia sp. CPCC 206044 TaxID=3140793 RepID=UPI003AF35F0C